MRWLVPALLLAGAATAAAQPDFEARLDRIAEVTSEWFSRSVPVPAASAGVTYEFDPATGSFVRDAAPHGQVFVERAQPIGGHKINLSANYQWLALDSIGGRDVERLDDPVPVLVTPATGAALRVSRLELEADVQQVTFVGTYGVTDDLDLSIAVPLAHTSSSSLLRLDALAVDALGQVVRLRAGLDDATKTWGPGDVLLRGKYRILDSAALQSSLGLVLRVPTGDEKELQGTGTLEVAPYVYASSRRLDLARWARLQGHLNAGVDFDTEDVGASEARWGVGVDWGVLEEVTMGLAVLGRHQFRRLAPAGALDVPRCGPTLVTCITGGAAARRPSSPLFGIDTGRPDFYDLSVGGRVSVWRETVIAFANLVVPLNDDGVRAGPIPLIGLEATF